MRYQIYERVDEEWVFVKPESSLKEARIWCDEQIQMENQDGVYHIIDSEDNEIKMTIGTTPRSLE